MGEMIWWVSLEISCLFSMDDDGVVVFASRRASMPKNGTPRGDNKRLELWIKGSVWISFLLCKSRELSFLSLYKAMSFWYGREWEIMHNTWTKF